MLEISNLNYRIGTKQILSDINLSVETGTLLAIMGQSGCGKTTLLKSIAGLNKPTTGSIRIGGVDVVNSSEKEIAQVRIQMGLVFQYAALFDSLNVYDNVSFGLVRHKKFSRSKCSKIVADRLAEVGMAGTEKLFPSELSGGMQKRIGLARALAMEPSLLLYDEPTSGLDPVIARNIDDLIVETKVRRSVTSVVVSHDIRSIFRIADKIAMLSEGKLIAYGTPAELRSSSNKLVLAFLED